MNTYIVTFEIHDLQRRNKVKEHLRSYDSFCPIHDNTAAIRTNKTAVYVRDALNQIALPKDRIFIIRSGMEAAWYNSYGNENTNWLKTYL